MLPSKPPLLEVSGNMSMLTTAGEVEPGSVILAPPHSALDNEGGDMVVFDVWKLRQLPGYVAMELWTAVRPLRQLRVVLLRASAPVWTS